MPEFTLHARTALGAAEPMTRTWPGATLIEITDRPLASVAARRGRDEALRQAVVAGFGVELPGPGRWVGGPSLAFAWTGRQQWFADAGPEHDPEDGPWDGGDIVARLGAALGDSASITDQSDAWARFELSGPRARAVLERLCPLDLHPAAFPPGAFARTAMEHLGAFVALLEPAPRFLLLAARSSAGSFVQAIAHAAEAATDLSAQ